MTIQDTLQNPAISTPDSNQTTEQADTPKMSFDDLQLNKPILKALEKSGYTTPTPIQAGAIPHALNGRDLLLSAQTGSGKTAAFVLPVLDKLSREKHLDKSIHTLILTPTRELAQQVQDSVRRYGGNIRGLYSIPLVGGSPYSGQIRALRKGVQIVIATPGRLIDHMREGRVDLSALKVLILDEADRMLDMGFADDIKEILQNTPESRQTVMSSATWDGAVGAIAESFTNNPEKVSIKVESAHIEESVYLCDDFNHKNKILLEVLNNPEIKQAVIFTATKMSTERLAGELVEAGFKARYLHGDLPQGKRNRIVSDMKSGKCDLLIATDVAARGIDISAISHVVNYDLPRQVEDYVHRIGRCGRAGRTGVAINLCSLDDRKQLFNINRYLKRQMQQAVIEGLEPKRHRPLDDTDRKGGDRRRKGKAERDDKPRFARGKHKTGRFGRYQDENRHGQEERVERVERGERFDRFEKGEKPARFDRNDRFERHGNHTDERFDRSEKTKRFDRSDYYGAARKSDDRQRSFGDKFGGSKERFVKEDRFDGKRGEKSFGAKSTKPFYDKPVSRSRSKKPKVVEEIFFAKRQEKKAKKRFGEMD